MTIIHLVRHAMHRQVGHVLSGRSEIPLDAEGLEQAEVLASHLAGQDIGSIHSSPRRRALETAAPLARAQHLPVETASALDEIDFGAFTGRAFAALDDDPQWRRWNSERASARCPDGETMSEAVARGADFLFGLPEVQSPALCVTHCDMIRGIVAHLLGMPMSHMFMLGCDPASITTLSIDRGGIKLVELNRRARP